MPKKWSEVSSSPEFQALAPEAKESARSQYFDQVVAPRVPRTELSRVRSQFDSETSLAPKNQVAETESTDGGLKDRLMGMVEDALGRGAQGAIASIPYAGRVQSLLRGGEAYTEAPGIDRASAQIGDASQAALTVLTGGRGLGLGAALNAGLEATGVNPLARKLSAKISDADIYKDFPSEVMGIEGLGTGLNALQRVPATLASTALEAAPAILVGSKVAKAQKAKGIKAAGESAPLRSALDDLKAHGGEAPISSQVPTKIGKAVAATAERGAKVDPFTKGTFEATDAKNTTAAKNFFQKTLGQDIFEPVKEKVGQSMERMLDKIVDRRASEYDPAVSELKKTGKTRGFGSKVARDGINEIKISDIDPASPPAQAWKKTLAGISSVDDPKMIDKKLTTARILFKQKFANGVVPDQFARDYGAIEKAVKNSFYDGLDQISGGLDNKLKVTPLTEGVKSVKSGGLGSRLREAKGDYADTSQRIEGLSEILEAKNSPEFVMQAVFQKGAKPVREFMALLEPSDKKVFQKEAARWLVDQAKDTKGNVTSKTLEKIPAKYRDIIPAIFDDSHGQSVFGYIKRGEALMKAANIDEIGNFNSSGTGKTMMEQAYNPIALGSTMIGGGAAGGVYGGASGALAGALLPVAAVGSKVALDTAYAKGLPALLKGARALNQSPSGFTGNMPRQLKGRGQLANILKAKQQQDEAERLQRR